MGNVEVQFFAADPRGAAPNARKLMLEDEVRQIREQVHLAPYGKKLRFYTHGAARANDLLEALSETRPQIVHFSGHGGHDGVVLFGANGEGAQRVPPEALRTLFSTFPGDIRLVVLNACHSLDQARAIADVVGCAVGAPGWLPDPAAIIFARRFYRAIASGKSVKAAHEEGRLALKLEDYADVECPQLVSRADVDPARLVLIPSPAMWVRRRVAAAFAAIVLSLGAVYQPWEVIDPAESERLALIQQAAHKGDPEAMGLLGIAHLEGKGTAPNPVLGVMWLRRAISKGRDGAAMNALGAAYEEGDGVDRRMHLARHWYQAAAEEKGHVEAMRNFGRLLRETGTDSTDREALAWLRKAAAAESVEAMVDLGEMYERGRPAIRDTTAALSWYSAAARKGSARAMAAIGRVYENGIGVPRNYERARVWYRDAADLKFADAMNSLGILYQNGWGVPADRTQARRWFRRAAKAGSPLAEDNLQALAAR